MNRAFGLLSAIVSTASMYAQVGPFPGTSVPLSSTYQHSALVPLGILPL